MRPASALAAILSLALTACGAASNGTGRPPLERGHGQWVLRYNPASCLVDRPTLHAEVRLAAGWERVNLEDADRDTPEVEALLSAFAADPEALQAVEGELVRETRAWLGSHAARVLQVSQRVPLPPAAEAPTEATPSAP